MAEEKKLRAGDKVEWETSQGTTSGRVAKKVTGRTRIKGHEGQGEQGRPAVRRDERQDRRPGGAQAHRAEEEEVTG